MYNCKTFKKHILALSDINFLLTLFYKKIFENNVSSYNEIIVYFLDICIFNTNIMII